MTEATFTISDPMGLHARPVGAFVRKARSFKSKISLQNLSSTTPREVPVNSPVQLLNLGAKQGNQLLLRAEGEDEAEAVAALLQLVVDEQIGQAD